MNKICKHCNQSFDVENGKVFSNHVRWCEANPSRLVLSKAATAGQKIYLDSKLGEKKHHTKTCKKCGSEFTVFCRDAHVNNVRYATNYCSLVCANSRDRNDEVRQKISDSIVKYHTIANAGYIAPVQYPIIKQCVECNVEFDVMYNERRRRYCSDTCRKAKFNRVDNELRRYRTECMFRFSMNTYPDEFDFDLIRTYGWYKAANRGNNLTGVSRDHIISVRYGFDNGISPEIISHPANCQLMQHGLNVSKSSGCGITLDELKVKIDAWDAKYGKFTPLPWKDAKTIQ